MGLSTHHTAALTGAVVTSAIALFDAATHGITGHFSVFADDSDRPLLVALGSLAHGLTYVALCFVLVREARQFSTVNRVAQAVRWVVIVSLALLAPGFLLVAPILTFADVTSGTAYTVWGGIAGLAFAGMILGSLVLGIALLRTRSLGIGARVLSLMAPVLGMTLLLAWLAPAWAHPAYLETTLHFGIALLGVTTSRASVTTTESQTSEQPTAA